MKVINNERDGLLGVIPQFGGQTAINLVDYLQKENVPILGSSASAITSAEDRKLTGEILSRLGMEMPKWDITYKKGELLAKAEELGYPVLVRPSFVLGGEGMIIAR